MPYNGHMLTTVVTQVLPNSATSRAIGELTCQQTTAYNEAVALLNTGYDHRIDDHQRGLDVVSKKCRQPVAHRANGVRWAICTVDPFCEFLRRGAFPSTLRKHPIGFLGGNGVWN